jgi:hypothetical protein
MTGRSGPDDDARHEGLQGLCRPGGVAARLLVVYSLATMVQLAVLGGQPGTAAEAFRLLQEDKVVGLLRLGERPKDPG